MAIYEDLIIDGTPLSSLSLCVTDLSGLNTITGSRGGNVQFPGVNGETFVPKPMDTNTISFGVAINGTAIQDFNAVYRAFKILVRPGKLLALQRNLGYATGNETHIADGECPGFITPEMVAMKFGRFTFELRVLTGVWFNNTTTITSPSNSTVSILGETNTRRMTISMTSGTLTNTTTGASLTYSGSGTATIDVEAMTANNGSDVSSQLTWTKAFPMELAPGNNTFIGSATITYRAAYL